MILILLLLNIISLILFNDSNLILSCGLFGFIGPNPTKYFSWDKFNMLGWFNDSRGGDACGRVIGNLHEHGVGKLSTYKEFAMQQKNPNIKKMPTTILGHCRKASSGGKDDMYAQPIVFTKQDVDFKLIKDTHLKKLIKTLKDDDIVFSGIHNGTIDNYLDLAETYKIPTENYNDSKVLLSALFYGNFDILEQYVGTASLVWHNHIYNKTFVFKGESKLWNTSVNTSEERPLYCWDIGEDNYYFSSLEDSLLLIGAIPEKTVDIIPNTVHIFTNGLRTKVLKVNRLESTQSKPYVNSSNTSIQRFNRNEFNHWNGKNTEFDSWEHNRNVKKQVKDLWTPSSNSIVSSSYLETSKCIRKFSNSGEQLRIQGEINKNYSGDILKCATYNKTRYWMHGGLMHGVYLLNSIGSIPSNLTRDTIILKLYYFIEGVLLDGYTGYIKAEEIHNEFLSDLMDNPSDIVFLERTFIEELTKYSRFPVAPLLNTVGIQYTYACIRQTSSDTIYSGSFCPLFSEKRYIFSTGNLISIFKTKDGVKSAIHTTDDIANSEIYLKRCKTDPNLSDNYSIGFKLINDTEYSGGILNPKSPLQSFIYTNYVEDEVEMALTIFATHYNRDFRNKLKERCELCSSRDTASVWTCSYCEYYKVEINNLINEANYGIPVE